MDNLNLLDKIETKDKLYYGIIDFVSKKQIIFYDMTYNESVSARVAILAWRMECDDVRFSIFIKRVFPEFILPHPIIIPTNSILNKESIALEPTQIKKKIKKV